MIAGSRLAERSTSPIASSLMKRTRSAYCDTCRHEGHSEPSCLLNTQGFEPLKYRQAKLIIWLLAAAIPRAPVGTRASPLLQARLRAPKNRAMARRQSRGAGASGFGGAAVSTRNAASAA